MTAGAASNFVDALHAETRALSNAVQLADQLGVGPVLFKMDSLMLERAVVTNLYDFALLGQVFRDIKAKLNNQFIHADVVYVRRECNKPAHVSGAMGVGLATRETQVWLDDFPADVTHLVTDNSTVS